MSVSVRELRVTVSKKGFDNNIFHMISPYFTSFFLLSGFNANQVSIMGFLCGAVAAIFFVYPYPLFFVFGGFLLFLSMVFDCSDGEVARYMGTQDSLFGGFFDWFNHQSKVLVLLALTVCFMGVFPFQGYILCMGLIFCFFWFMNTTFKGLIKHVR